MSLYREGAQVALDCLSRPNADPSHFCGAVVTRLLVKSAIPSQSRDLPS